MDALALKLKFYSGIAEGEIGELAYTVLHASYDKGLVRVISKRYLRREAIISQQSFLLHILATLKYEAYVVSSNGQGIWFLQLVRVPKALPQFII